MAYYIQMKNPTTGIEEIIPEMVLDFEKKISPHRQITWYLWWMVKGCVRSWNNRVSEINKI